ncbi:hypothetical protein GQ457_01G018210 [Hibiscus cannabinus]
MPIKDPNHLPSLGPSIDQKLGEAIEDTKLEQRRRNKGIYRGYLLDVTDIFRRLVRKYFCVHKELLIWFGI